MHTKNEYIAVFDSGLGGISVLKELCKLMPQEQYLYFGDSANAPYGAKTTQEVRALTMDAAERLLERNVKALVVACNTATAAAINDLRAKYPNTIIVGIEPAVKMAADRCHGGTIGVMATPVTLREEKFNHLLERFSQEQIISISAPELVSLIETGASDDTIEKYLAPILSPYQNQLDAVVLGCTHYPFASKVIRKLLNTQVLDGGAGTARETKRRLEEADLLFEGPGLVQMENSAQDPEILVRAMELLKEEE